MVVAQDEALQQPNKSTELSDAADWATCRGEFAILRTFKTDRPETRPPHSSYGQPPKALLEVSSRLRLQHIVTGKLETMQLSAIPLHPNKRPGRYM